MKERKTAGQERRHGSRAPGFTLVELVVTLTLTGLLATVVGMALVPALEGFLQARRAAATAQGAQLAMTRMVREFVQTQSNTVSVVNNRAVTFTSRHGPGDAGLEPHTISWDGEAGNALLLDGTPLAADVQEFHVACGSGAGPIDVRLRLGGAANVAYEVRVFPRN